ncbi:hypothetical protein KC220_22650, partial [Mycobacterium tuberculosis]|nr:hypothetical protein [Mycobacterium tuberculosis]
LATLDAGVLAEALFGRGALTAPKARPTGPWPSARLAGALRVGLPVDVAVAVGRLGLGPDRALDGAKLRFSLADGEARLDDVVANFAGGKVGG